MNNLNQHVRSDKVKWIITGIALVLILAILGGVLAAVLTETNPKDWFEQLAGEETETSDEEAPANTENGGAVIGTPVENGIKLMSAKIPVAEFAANGVSAQAETAYTLTATIVPDTATDKTVDWEVAFVNPSSEWANGKVVTDYATVTPTSDGALTANVVCLQAFGEQIKVTVTSRQNVEATAICIIDYAKRINSVVANSVASSEDRKLSFNNSGEYILGTFLSAENYNFSVTESVSDNVGVCAYTPSFGVGTIDDAFTYSVTITYTEELVSAISAQGFDVAVQANQEISVDKWGLSLRVLFGTHVMTQEDGESVTIDAFLGTMGVYNKYSAAMRSLGNEVLATLTLTATGQYSTFVGTVDIVNDVSLFEILVQSVDLNDSSIVF